MSIDAKTTLKKYGFSLLLGILIGAVFIAAGALFPIPAVRSLALQVSITSCRCAYLIIVAVIILFHTIFIFNRAQFFLLWVRLRYLSSIQPFVNWF